MQLTIFNKTQENLKKGETKKQIETYIDAEVKAKGTIKNDILTQKEQLSQRLAERRRTKNRVNSLEANQTLNLNHS